jgi:Holliday junction resolvasome RuvABC ATP-dependent DNA helicase subunit
MTTQELKHKIIYKVNSIKDDDLLIEVMTLLEEKEESTEIHRLSTNHKKAIYKAIEEIENGKFITNEQSNKEIKEWLKK